MKNEGSPKVSRRTLFGLSAVAAGAVATSRAKLAFAGEGDSAEDGRGGAFGQLNGFTNAVQVPAIPGAEIRMIGDGGFVAEGRFSSGALLLSQDGGVFNEAPAGWVTAMVDIPAGATLVRLDAFGWSRDGGVQTWDIYRTRALDGTYLPIVARPTLEGPGLVAVHLVRDPIPVELGDSLSLSLYGTSAESSAFAAIYQYTRPQAPTSQSGFIPTAPSRVYDSRTVAAGKLASGQVRTVSCATAIDGATVAAPAGARAIAYNLTVTATAGAFGYLSVAPGGLAPSDTSSAINWDRAGATLANGLQVGLNANREIAVKCGGGAGASTHFLVDVVGYYL